MSDHNPGLLTSSRFFLVAAAIMVILASIKAASVIVVPFLLALFIAIVFQPAIFWFRSKGLPPILATSAIFVIILVLGSGFAGLVVNSVNEFTTNMPEYRGRLSEQFQALTVFAAGFNIHLDTQMLQNQFDPSRLLSMSVNLLSGLGNMMTNIFIILLIVVFMLSEAALMPKKIALAFPSPEKKLSQMSHLLMAINKYLALKTVISILTGVLIGAGLWLMGVDHYILWGVIAFLFNYIPNIGSIIAAVPAVLMALIQFNPAMAGFVALLFLAVNVVMGNFVEPRMMGRGLGLSTLVVFLSLIFWGWLLGPVGMLLSVPLTMGVKIGFNENPGTRWLAILLSGDEVRHLDAETQQLPIEKTDG
ncbi:hypothetical protein CWE08_09895 [Aliidiomarina iranensis]|uniref:Pheromone autoinducer 2 transporter n=1 Tax=Aliidiomarina iranensis TaxID=1434071 RepID=A0A432VSF4_9GAMM|nr:AI-2E family transporter [Aliidiomarina iranensis]RUO19289.1 hypothetical protein CWE08_09895 [Aliidiomarina iranensis]